MNALSRALGIVVTVVLVAAPAMGQDAAAEKTLIANERAVQAAVMKGDVAAFTKYVSTEGVAMDGMMGRTIVADFLKTLPQMLKDMKIESWDITDTKVTWVDANTGVLTYKWMGKGTFQGQPIPSTWASTVWTKRNGNWVAVFHQESNIEAPPAAKK